MTSPVFYIAGGTDALAYAAKELKQKGCSVIDSPDESVTHLLLDVPSFDANGSLRGGGDIADVLSRTPQDVTVVGGNLQHPSLVGYKTIDLLQDAVYVAENAQITAHCAIKHLLAKLNVILPGSPVLVVGWGRIGKCLASLLKAMGAIVTVAVRKPSDHAMLLALGYDAAWIDSLSYDLFRYYAIVNSVPAMVLPKDKMQYCAKDCVKIDLASLPGIADEDVLWARGLPGKDAPISSGKLIAKTVLRLR